MRISFSVQRDCAGPSHTNLAPRSGDSGKRIQDNHLLQGAAGVCRTSGLLETALHGTPLMAVSLGVGSRRPSPTKGNPQVEWGRNWWGNRASPPLGLPAAPRSPTV